MRLFEPLKTLYAALGARHPIISLVIVFFACGAAGAVLWQVGAYLNRPDRQTIIQPPSMINTTTGPASPILPNNGGNVTINNDDSKSKESAPKDKPK